MLIDGMVKCLGKNETLSEAWWQANANKLALIAIETQTLSPIIQKIGFSLAIVNNSQIQNLNRKHRGLNKTTDVLSFPTLIDFSLPLPEIDLGDIVISEERLLAQAKEYNHSIEREAAFLFVHGFLHLLNYDHELSLAAEQEMFELQDTILTEAGFLRL